MASNAWPLHKPWCRGVSHDGECPPENSPLFARASNSNSQPDTNMSRISSSTPASAEMPETQIERDARDRLDRYRGGASSWDVRRADIAIVLHRLAKVEAENQRLADRLDAREREIKRERGRTRDAEEGMQRREGLIAELDRTIESFRRSLYHATGESEAVDAIEVIESYGCDGICTFPAILAESREACADNDESRARAEQAERERDEAVLAERAACADAVLHLPAPTEAPEGWASNCDGSRDHPDDLYEAAFNQGVAQAYARIRARSTPEASHD